MLSEPLGINTKHTTIITKVAFQKIPLIKNRKNEVYIAKIEGEKKKKKK